jgi:hypothetical protein
MSIDAQVAAVTLYEDGSGALRLVDRPAPEGGTPGIAGQAVLRFDRAPAGLKSLAGRQVWGGDSDLMLGERRIARRVGYTRLEFVGGEDFDDALAADELRRLRIQV